MERDKKGEVERLTEITARERARERRRRERKEEREKGGRTFTKEERRPG